MRRAIRFDLLDKEGSDFKPPRWVLLPGLCCQAVGGLPLNVDTATAAWFLFYTAAHLMDHVQDLDEPEAWYADLGNGAALSAATGLFFTAWRVINNLSNESKDLNGAEVIDDFQKSFLTISAGQFHDLVNPKMTLKQYWQAAEAKSGAFFALACRTGARLAGADESRINAFSRFGLQVGLLVQLLDDLEDLNPPPGKGPAHFGPETNRSIAFIYAREVLPLEAKQHLDEVLKTVSQTDSSRDELLSILDNSGAGLYLATEKERHLHLAQLALEEAEARSPAQEELLALLSP